MIEGVTKRPRRPLRAERRADEREARKLVRAREQLFRASWGGSRERPIELDASPVIEVRARSMPCPQCEGRYAIEQEEAVSAELRALHVRCITCGVARTLWFRLVRPLPN
jgi:hypothetical protein